MSTGYVHWLKRRLSNLDGGIEKKIDDMRAILGNTVDVVRKICSELRPGLLDDFGISAAIEWQVEEFQQRTGIVCKLYSSPAEISLNEELSIAMFRILQESLTNTAKHAEATRVTIHSEHSKDQFKMQIKDNGTGISPVNCDSTKTFGLIGMQERVNDLGGKFSIHPGNQEGTVVEVELEADSEPCAENSYD